MAAAQTSTNPGSSPPRSPAAPTAPTAAGAKSFAQANSAVPASATSPRTSNTGHKPNPSAAAPGRNVTSRWSTGQIKGGGSSSTGSEAFQQSADAPAGAEPRAPLGRLLRRSLSISRTRTSPSNSSSVSPGVTNSKEPISLSKRRSFLGLWQRGHARTSSTASTDTNSDFANPTAAAGFDPIPEEAKDESGGARASRSNPTSPPTQQRQRQQQQSQSANSTTTSPPTIMAAAKHPPASKGSSFRQKFWTRGSANHFGGGDGGDDEMRSPPINRPMQPYVPKHAGADFSRMQKTPAYMTLDPREQRDARQRANRSPPPDSEDVVPPSYGAGITVMRNRQDPVSPPPPAWPVQQPLRQQQQQQQQATSPWPPQPRYPTQMPSRPHDVTTSATTGAAGPTTATATSPAYASHAHNYSITSNPFTDRSDNSYQDEEPAEGITPFEENLIDLYAEREPLAATQPAPAAAAAAVQEPVRTPREAPPPPSAATALPTRKPVAAPSKPLPSRPDRPIESALPAPEPTPTEAIAPKSAPQPQPQPQPAAAAAAAPAQPQEQEQSGPSDFELFLARAAEEERVASDNAWRAIRRGSGNGVPRPPWGAGGVGPGAGAAALGQMYLPSNAGTSSVARTNTLRTSKRDSAHTGGGGGGRISTDRTTTTDDVEEKQTWRSGTGSGSASSPREYAYGERLRGASASPSPPPPPGGQAGLNRRPSLSKKVAAYIKPVQQETGSGGMSGHSRNGSRGAGRLRSKFAEGVREEQ